MSERNRTQIDDIKDGILIMRASFRQMLGMPEQGFRAYFKEMVQKGQQPESQNPQQIQSHPQPERIAQASQTPSSSQGSKFDQALNQRKSTDTRPFAGCGPFGIIASLQQRFTPQPPPALPSEEELKLQEMRDAAERIKADRQRREEEKRKLRKHRGYSSVSR